MIRFALAACVACIGLVSLQAADPKADVTVKEGNDKATCKVKDVVFFAFPYSSAEDKASMSFKVKINGKAQAVGEKDTVHTGPIGGGDLNYIWTAAKKGKYEFEITPTYTKDGKTKDGKTRKHTVTVE